MQGQTATFVCVEPLMCHENSCFLDQLSPADRSASSQLLIISNPLSTTAHILIICLESRILHTDY
jgi:hypothetical protein